MEASGDSLAGELSAHVPCGPGKSAKKAAGHQAPSTPECVRRLRQSAPRPQDQHASFVS